jgi:hypothetical protein
MPHRRALCSLTTLFCRRESHEPFPRLLRRLDPHPRSGRDGRDTTQGPVPASGGFAGDAGVALDFHLIRHLGFGLHAEYVTIEATPFVPDWVAFGLHADVAL